MQDVFVDIMNGFKEIGEMKNRSDIIKAADASLKKHRGFNESADLSDMSKTHNEYYILYSTVGELCNFEHTDAEEANDHIDDAMDLAVADLTKQVESSINSVLPEPTAKVKAHDNQAQATGEGSVAMLIYIDKSVNRKDAFKAIANGVDCIGIGTTTFETTDPDNYSIVHADDHIPHYYAGWREYDTIDASADVCLTITKYDELDDDGFVISN